jgi:hypothetical protein
MRAISTLSVFSLLLSPSYMAFAAGEAQHFPGVFVGMTNADSETEFTYGIEHEYKFGKQWGVGAVYEKTDDAHHEDGVTVKLTSIYYHPVNNVLLGLGFGEEKIGVDHPHSEDL